MKHRTILLLAVLFTGCARSSNRTTDTTSDQLPSLEARVQFVEVYVVAGRRYSELSFHIRFQDNSGGMVPGPSDWDFRLVASVTANELADWIPAGATPINKPELDWLATVPNSKRAAGITEWYKKGRTTIGIDRKQNIVAYRAMKY